MEATSMWKSTVMTWTMGNANCPIPNIKKKCLILCNCDKCQGLPLMLMIWWILEISLHKLNESTWDETPPPKKKTDNVWKFISKFHQIIYMEYNYTTAFVDVTHFINWSILKSINYLAEIFLRNTLLSD